MKLETIEKSIIYHIYNRGINSQNIFFSSENKRYFLYLFNKHLSDKVDLLAYCLMDNHFHFVIRVIAESKEATQSMSNFLNAYVKAFNKMYGRTGSLFEKHFKRIRVNDEIYLKNLIIYIHQNPTDFEHYSFSSYQRMVNHDKTLEQVSEIIALFGGIDNFILNHKQPVIREF